MESPHRSQTPSRTGAILARGSIVVRFEAGSAPLRLGSALVLGAKLLQRVGQAFSPLPRDLGRLRCLDGVPRWRGGLHASLGAFGLGVSPIGCRRGSILLRGAFRELGGQVGGTIACCLEGVGVDERFADVRFRAGERVLCLLEVLLAWSTTPTSTRAASSASSIRRSAKAAPTPSKARRTPCRATTTATAPTEDAGAPCERGTSPVPTMRTSLGYDDQNVIDSFGDPRARSGRFRSSRLGRRPRW